jgi:hypothetical protein
LNRTNGLSQTALFKALGLPADRLSASIVSFAKFFSLPLEPAFLAHIRRQANVALRSGAAATAEAADTTANAATPGEAAAADATAAPVATAAAEAEALISSREALSLAALAAADKGLELSAAGLEEYAAAIDPDRRDNSQEKEGKKQAKQTSPQSISLSPHQLKEQFLQSAENNPLLSILNRLPGKNGQRWMVFPFSYTENGALYRMTLKILLDGEVVRRMSFEIAITEPKGDIGNLAKQDRRWLFIMDSEKPGEYRLTLMLKPQQSRLKSIVERLSKIMEIPRDRISVKNYTDSFCADSRDDLLHSINKEV